MRFVVLLLASMMLASSSVLAAADHAKDEYGHAVALDTDPQTLQGVLSLSFLDKDRRKTLQKLLRDLPSSVKEIAIKDVLAMSDYLDGVPPLLNVDTLTIVTLKSIDNLDLYFSLFPQMKRLNIVDPHFTSNVLCRSPRLYDPDAAKILEKNLANARKKTVSIFISRLKRYVSTSDIAAIELPAEMASHRSVVLSLKSGRSRKFTAHAQKERGSVIIERTIKRKQRRLNGS